MKYRTLRYSLGASLLLCFVAGAAFAQSSTKSAGAETVYEEPHDLMKPGDFEPGTQQVPASAPNKATYEQCVEIENGSSTLEIPKLAAAPGAARDRARSTRTPKRSRSRTKRQRITASAR